MTAEDSFPAAAARGGNPLAIVPTPCATPCADTRIRPDLFGDISRQSAALRSLFPSRECDGETSGGSTFWRDSVIMPRLSGSHQSGGLRKSGGDFINTSAVLGAEKPGAASSDADAPAIRASGAFAPGGIAGSSLAAYKRAYADATSAAAAVEDDSISFLASLAEAERIGRNSFAESENVPFVTQTGPVPRVELCATNGAFGAGAATAAAAAAAAAADCGEAERDPGPEINAGVPATVHSDDETDENSDGWVGRASQEVEFASSLTPDGLREAYKKNRLRHDARMQALVAEECRTLEIAVNEAVNMGRSRVKYRIAADPQWMDRLTYEDTKRILLQLRNSVINFYTRRKFRVRGSTSDPAVIVFFFD